MNEVRGRVLKVPSPEFLLNRLKSRKEALILSGASHEKLVGEVFTLINERKAEDEPTKAFGRITFTQEPKSISNIRALGRRRESVDPLMLREFEVREAPFFILRLQLKTAFATPKLLRGVPPGRFSSVIELPESDDLDEAFHLRDTHWKPVPEDGGCPVSHPNKMKSPEGETRCYTDSAATALRQSKESREEISEQERPSLKAQTYILSKERFKTQGAANKWMDENDVPRPKVDETEGSFRYRQFPPDRCQEGTARTTRITDGVQIVGCRLKPEFREAVTKFTDLPLADRELAWDADEAEALVRRWATDDEEIDFDRYSKAFVVVDGPEDNLTSYKLPFATVTDGQLTAVPRGIFAGAAALQGARGGIDLPSGDLTRAQNHLGQYYTKMDLRAPWETDESISEQALPKTKTGLTIAEVFEKMKEKGEKFSQDETNYQERAPSPEVACGSCRFYLRNPDGSAIGLCQVVEGPIPWSATSDLYVSADAEARAAFAMEKKEEPAQQA